MDVGESVWEVPGSGFVFILGELFPEERGVPDPWEEGGLLFRRGNHFELSGPVTGMVSSA